MVYVYLDCNKTQDYVFSSRRLRGIRNGSRAVEKADQDVGKYILQMNGGVIRALGGVVIAKFPSSLYADNFLRFARRRYLDYGISIEAAYMEYPAPEDFYGDVLVPLLKKIRTKKDCPKRIVLPPPSTILAATCDTSGRGAAGGRVKLGPREIHNANAVEKIKWDMVEDDRVAENLVQEWTDAGIPSTVDGVVAWSTQEEIDEKKLPGTSEQRLLGMVFADVNQLGNLLKYLAKNERKFSGFSCDLKKCLEDSLKQALQAILSNPVRNQCTKDSSKNAVPFKLLFLGGDDLCFVVVGAYALQLTKMFIETFEQMSSQILEPLRVDSPNLPSYLTLSAGIVIAPYNYPILSFRRLGQEGLEANTKQKGRAWAKLNGGVYPPSLVDFYFVKNDAAGKIEDVRRHSRKANYKSNGEQVDLFGGPYLVSKGKTGHPHPASTRFLPLEDLLKAAKELNEIQASGKLKALPSLLSQDGSEFLYREWWNHLGEYEQSWRSICQELLDVPAERTRLPVREYPHLNTPVLDALHLMPLVELQERLER